MAIHFGLRNFFLSLLQILIFPALYAVNFYSRRRMGFMRYLVYLNRKWETLFLSENFKVFLLVGAISIFIYQLIKLYRKKSCNFLMIIFSLALVGVLRKFIFSGIINSIFIVGILILIVLESIKKTSSLN